MRQKFKPLHLALAVTAAVSAWPALAQDAPAAEKNKLDTVVVTAQRREENIKDVPTAVSTISGDALDALNASG